jgi:hypothetical protein
VCSRELIFGVEQGALCIEHLQKIRESGVEALLCQLPRTRARPHCLA